MRPGPHMDPGWPAFFALAAALMVCAPLPARAGTCSCTNALDTAAEIQAAMRNATPGTIIPVAPGVHVGSTSGSGDPSGKGRFYSGRSGTAESPIVLVGCDPANPAVLSGISVGDGSYALHLTGDHWQVRDLVVTNAQKGIMIDNGNHHLLSGLEVHRIGDEGVHFRDGSSYNVLMNSKIHDTGNYQSGFGEGAYVGSDAASSYEHTVVGNIIRGTDFAGDITAEHIDIKEGADGTIVEYCTFNGIGISGNNSADSFVDVKGVNSVIRFNQGSRNGNGAVTDAFQVRTHGSGFPTGRNNAFHDNTVDLDDAPGYIVYATSSTVGTTAYNDVRIGGGKRYSSNVAPGSPTTVGTTPASAGAVELRAWPNPSHGAVTIEVLAEAPAPARIGIFDLSGRKVADVAEIAGVEGPRVTRWDGRDDSGREAKAGVYLVRLEVAGRVITRPVTMVR